MNSIKEEIVKIIFEQIESGIDITGNDITGIDITGIERLIEVPPDSNLGDYSFPCFQLSRILRKSPNIIASELTGKIIKPETIDRIDNVGGYVNFFINKSKFATLVLEDIAKQGDNYGRSDLGAGKTIVIDYCAINIAKPLFIHHLPSTVIGNSLYKIHQFLGYRCVGINHLGDWGTQFGKLIVAYKKWGNKEDVEKDPINELVKIYVQFHIEAEADESLNDEARAAFKAIEDGNEEHVELWKWFREISIAGFKRILSIMKIDFDTWDGESFYNDKMEPVIDELKDKGLLQESQGAQIVDLSELNIPPCIILRSDGATLYATRDIAAILYRKEMYDFHKVLYCVATQQNLHFQQIFKVIELMGYEWVNDLVHVTNGMISLEAGAMSTRKGTVVYLDDVLNDSIAKAMNIIEERNPELTGKDEIAKMIGIGAVKFSALKNKRVKDSVFTWENVLNFDGETSCYIQYTYARICSILRKAGLLDSNLVSELSIDYSILAEGESYQVIKQLSQFPQIVEDAANEYEPSTISKYLIDLVQCFNKFYNDSPILKSEGKLRDSRLELCMDVKLVIYSGMALLGIDCPDRM